MKKVILLIIIVVINFVISCNPPLSSNDPYGYTGYFVTYKANAPEGATVTGTVPIDNNEYKVGMEVTVLENSGNLATADFYFLRWNTAADGNGTTYSSGDKLTVNGEYITLYAIWGITAIGNSYGGGVVAYVDNTGKHGLIAATSDQSTGIVWALSAYQSTAVPGGTSSSYGTGLSNTNNIISQNGAGTDYAAGLARAYSGGGYKDWYLPSSTELHYLYTNLAVKGLGGFTLDKYWSSSDDYLVNYYIVWIVNFGNINDPYPICTKNGSLRVRAVRSF